MTYLLLKKLHNLLFTHATQLEETSGRNISCKKNRLDFLEGKHRWLWVKHTFLVNGIIENTPHFIEKNGWGIQHISALNNAWLPFHSFSKWLALLGRDFSLIFENPILTLGWLKHDIGSASGVRGNRWTSLWNVRKV